jgi:hypothetical protein
MAIARNGVIDSDAGMDFGFLDLLPSVLPGVCSRVIADIQNHVTNNGADFGEIMRVEPRGRSKDAQ